MKQNILSSFHYVIFFWTAFLLTPPKITQRYEKSYECDSESQFKTEKAGQFSLAKENTADLLKGAFLFKY